MTYPTTPIDPIKGWQPPYEPPPRDPYAGFEPAPRKKKRIFMWFFLAVQILFLIWIITGINNVGHSICDQMTAETCQNVKGAAGSIGVFIIVFFWMMVDFILAIGYGVYKMARR